MNCAIKCRVSIFPVLPVLLIGRRFFEGVRFLQDERKSLLRDWRIIALDRTLWHSKSQRTFAPAFDEARKSSRWRMSWAVTTRDLHFLPEKGSYLIIFK